jgi:glycosyltransferase involved in cell wall biosynthesis
MWLPTNAVAAWVAHQRDIPLIVSTRGMLTSWSLRHHRWKKRLAWWGYQRHVFAEAAAFHVTSSEEIEALRSLGLHQPAALIPNGVPLPSLPGTAEPTGPVRRALFLSRVHPKKGLPMLLEAWANVAPEGWELVIAGPSENGHRAELEEKVRRLQLGDDVRFAGPVPDAKKWDEYRQADLFVLPTHSENFGIVVAEALAAKCPVITTTGAPWEDLDTHGCGWWTEPTVPSLTEALRDALGRSDAERRRMGERGRAVVEEKYSWPGVAGEMKRVYRWMVEGGEHPPSVRVGA